MYIPIIYTMLIWTVLKCILAEVNNVTLSFDDDNEPVSKVLSRRKRFLIFPDGSSVQLVYCTQNHGYLQIGNIVWFGTTAALAWELPTDPEVFDMFRDKEKLYDANRRTNVIYYTDDMGKIVDRREYKRKIIINPAFAKRSLDTKEQMTITTKLPIKEMHNLQKNKNIMEELDVIKINSNRKEKEKLYVKLEKFLQALGWNGKECVLQMLCQTSKVKNVQGSFLDEIIKAIFILPKVQVPFEVHNRYDDAHGSNGECAHMYPNCERSI